MGIGVLIIVLVLIVVIRRSYLKDLDKAMEQINMEEEWEAANHDAEKMARTVAEKTKLDYRICLKRIDDYFLREVSLGLLLEQNVFNVEYTTNLVYEKTQYDKVRIRKNLQAEYDAFQELVKLQERADYSKKK